jgi:hypothetical protein
MDGVSLNTGMEAAQAMLVRSAGQDTEKTAKLLKKALQSEQDLVATLLPPPGGRLDIKA